MNSFLHVHEAEKALPYFIPKSKSDLTLPSLEKSNNEFPHHSTPSPHPTNSSPLKAKFASLLFHLADTLHRHTTQYPPPQPPHLPTLKWSWDPAWRELLVWAPQKQCYLYLGRYTHNEVGQLRHCNVSAREDWTEEKARRVVLSWEHWKIDAEGKWFLEVCEGEEKYWVCAAYWRAEKGKWWFVERV
ncbi:hypothetical protein P171DRAFT_431018 [Karstenula rhodostoma CBS 690.94]|uniref:Uncharacterized protein n=1 Tax=Karstenula rhodostoma CBS 690.94 TaxID=1392251 RepID=A0A9P4PMH6_9PLEO|nr:hypothetical protein P171DRAFT_431018 [Karstenula rhodostoma CBS 690.94]